MLNTDIIQQEEMQKEDEIEHIKISKKEYNILKADIKKYKGIFDNDIKFLNENGFDKLEQIKDFIVKTKNHKCLDDSERYKLEEYINVNNIYFDDIQKLNEKNDIISKELNKYKSDFNDLSEIVTSFLKNVGCESIEKAQKDFLDLQDAQIELIELFNKYEFEKKEDLFSFLKKYHHVCVYTENTKNNEKVINEIKYDIEKDPKYIELQNKLKDLNKYNNDIDTLKKKHLDELEDIREKTRKETIKDIQDEKQMKIEGNDNIINNYKQELLKLKNELKENDIKTQESIKKLNNEIKIKDEKENKLINENKKLEDKIKSYENVNKNKKSENKKSSKNQVDVKDVEFSLTAKYEAKFPKCKISYYKNLDKESESKKKAARSTIHNIIHYYELYRIIEKESNIINKTKDEIETSVAVFILKNKGLNYKSSSNVSNYKYIMNRSLYLYEKYNEKLSRYDFNVHQLGRMSKDNWKIWKEYIDYFININTPSKGFVIENDLNNCNNCDTILSENEGNRIDGKCIIDNSENTNIENVDNEICTFDGCDNYKPDNQIYCRYHYMLNQDNIEDDDYITDADDKSEWENDEEWNK